MASLKDIRAQIESTKNTQQITKAMKLVSAAKLRKAQHQITNMRPYALALRGVITDVAVTQQVSHPLMEQRNTEGRQKRTLLVVINSDRGLCGAFNTSINKFAENYYKENYTTSSSIDFLFIGKKAHDYFAKKNIKEVDYMSKLDKDVSYGLAAGVADRLMKTYLTGDYDEVRIIYNEFISAIAQKVNCERVLPIEVETSSFETEGSQFSKDIIFEPAPAVIIEQLLKKHFDLQVYRAMAESVASEHGARMTAMENASNNAKAMIDRLTLTYNKLRQEKITTELIEIVSGAEALK